MTLSRYHKKRDFSKTPEPKGNEAKSAHHLFVIQKHAASHLHYDFRIELEGVLKSWAIPKGPILDPHVKRLAMHVEDHPIEYGNFEGLIPKGQYGGGTVMLWDKGIWEPLDKNPSLAYKKGHLRFLLHAEKIKGRWDLIRFKDETHWFLIKHQDEFARDSGDYDLTEQLDKSVKSDQTMDEIAENASHIWSQEGEKKTPKRSKKKIISKKTSLLLPEGMSPSPFPDFISPQLATLVDKAPDGEQWLHEVKFDGYRILAFKQKNKVVLKSRNNKDWTPELLNVAEAIKSLPYEHFILDGEVVVVDKDGKSDFQLLQNSIKNNKQSDFLYFIFDILYLDQYDLTSLPLLERKSILKQVLSSASAMLNYSDHIVNEGQEVFEHACEHDLEGIISKRVNSPYCSHRNKDWLKVKCIKRQEFVIGGYTPPKGGRSNFGSLFLGVYNQAGDLEYTGNVGTGFDDTSLKFIYEQLLHHKSATNPFITKPPGFSTAHWVQPVLVGEVAFTEWTTDGHLRHPSFKGLRLDKKATEVIREKEIHLDKIPKEKTRSKKIKKKSELTGSDETQEESILNAVDRVSKSNKFVLTHPTKVLYPEDKITKQDLLNYYDAVSEYILPYISLRPLTLLRCPSHYQQCFYQRHFNKTTPKTLHPIEIEGSTEVDQYIYLNDKAGLLSLVQMGVLEIHPWGSHINHLEQPDILVIDLDPAPDVPWTQVVAAAIEIREHLIEYHLHSFVKSTGGKGLHVVIPILPEYEWDEVKVFTHAFVKFLEKLKPNEYISKMTKSKRKGKIFIDYLRNQRTATAIGAYSTRARIHAPVSTPLAWEELSDRIEENTYTIKTLPKRLNALQADPWKEFWKIKQSLRLDKL
jgi:bifunctional non-homologous end joining protein LigD